MNAGFISQVAEKSLKIVNLKHLYNVRYSVGKYGVVVWVIFLQLSGSQSPHF